MNALERSVSDALRAYGEGLDMTSQDVDRLERGLGEKQDQRQALNRRRGGRIWQGAVAACAVTGVVLGALALRDTPPPASPAAITVADLVGTWRVDDTPGAAYLWRIHPDGRLTISTRAADLLDSSPEAAWTVSTAPGGFTLTAEPLNEQCTMTFEGSITPEGTLRAKVTAMAGECPSEVGYVWPLTKISPPSPAGTPLTSLYSPTAETKVTSVVPLWGTWVLPGTGRILGIKSTGDYFVLDAGAATPREGTVSVDPDGAVVFTPATNPGCPVVYESATSTTSALRTRLVTSSCGRLGAETDTWIRLN